MSNKRDHASRLTREEALEFMREFNALTKKYGLVIRKADGPILHMIEWHGGTDYLDLIGEQKVGQWVFSAPWGG